MTGIPRLLAEYVAEYQAGGEADPIPYLDRAGDAQSSLLADEIDRYLTAAPRRPFNENAFNRSASVQTVDALERALSGQSGLWPALLPQLRARAGVKRGTLVDRLAVALGVAERRDKVGAYYHEMEQGSLAADGVSDRVLAALATIVGDTAESLRTAGRALSSTSDSLADPAPSFARITLGAAATPGAVDPALSQPQEWDEIDQLFCSDGRQG